MDLTKILAISGKPGLYKMVGDAKDKLIVESLLDGKRSPAFTSEKISTLQEISIYTETGDIQLEDLFRNIYEHLEGKPALNPKKASSDELKALFEKILPEYDRDAVYVSDMKKVFTWYNLLLDKEILEFTEEEEPEKEAEPETADDPEASDHPGESDEAEVKSDK